jgi:hypothetical protein
VSAIREALADEAPGVILDYVWGAPAETMFAALNSPQRPRDTGETAYVQIGALAGAEAALPSSLLRSRRIRVQGSGMGSVTMRYMLEAMPEYVARIAEGRVEVPIETYPLSQVAQAWTAKAEAGTRIVLTA